MSECPFANLVDPDTYADGMPCRKLQEIRESGPLVKIDDPITGIPYRVVTRQAELDYVSRNPALFSSAERSPFPMEFADDPDMSVDEMAGQIASAEVIGYATELANKYFANPDDSLLGALLEGEVKGRRISEEE